jgi:hypothetical protein
MAEPIWVQGLQETKALAKKGMLPLQISEENSRKGRASKGRLAGGARISISRKVDVPLLTSWRVEVTEWGS